MVRNRVKITITGTPGSGKSTLAKLLADGLGFEFYSGGNMRRETAKKHGMSLAEFNALGEKEDWTDKELDVEIERIGREEDDFVFESRLAWHFIPGSVKIFLDADEVTRVERLVPRKLEEESFEDMEEALESIKLRVASDKVRYMQYYGLDPYNKENFDIVIDSTNMTPQQVLKKALEELDR